MWNSRYIPASFWLCKWKTSLKQNYRPDTTGCMRAKLPFELSDVFWSEKRLQGKALRICLYLLQCLNIQMSPCMPLQAFWKVKCLYCNLVGRKQLCSINLNLIQKLSSGIYCQFWYSDHIGNIAFVLSSSLVWERFLIFSIVGIEAMGRFGRLKLVYILPWARVQRFRYCQSKQDRELTFYFSTNFTWNAAFKKRLLKST